MKIGMMVDFMGCGEMTSDDEYDDIEKCFKKTTARPCLFVRNLPPHRLSNDTMDVYVFDFGGLMPGCADLISSYMFELTKQIEDHPNTLFVIWSDFTGREFFACLEKEAKDYLGEHHNIIVSNGMTLDLEKRLKEFVRRQGE